VIDRDLFIRSIGFSTELCTELIYRSANLSDKEFIEELLSFLNYLNYYDEDIADKYGCWIEGKKFILEEDDEDEENKNNKEETTLEYWTGKTQELLEGLEEIKENGPKIIDDYKKESDELREVNSEFKEKNEFLSDIMKGNLSLDVDFFVVLYAGLVSSVYLNNIYKYKKLDSNTVLKYTLRSLCEELMKGTIDIVTARNIYDLYKKQLSLNDTDEDDIIKIRRRIYGNV